MIGVNLIPAQRRRQRQRGATIRRWLFAGVAYALVWVLVVVFCMVRWSPTDSPGSQLTRVNGQLTQVNAQLVELAQDLNEARTQLEAGRSITIRPDWSVALVVVSRCVDDTIVLRRCGLRPGPRPGRYLGRQTATGDSQAGSAGASTPTRWSVQLAGLGRSLEDVSDFVLRLEETGLFDRVKLVDSDPQQFLGHPATAFRLVCQIGDDR